MSVVSDFSFLTTLPCLDYVRVAGAVVLSGSLDFHPIPNLQDTRFLTALYTLDLAGFLSFSTYNEKAREH